jgi:hypothetical protein
MGNRAVITFGPFNEKKVGIYLHWNGGRDSVEAFVKACKKLGYRTPKNDPTYAFAGLAHVITTFMGGSSVGIGTCENLDCDNGDNGVYLIGDEWEITGRHYWRQGREEQVDEKTTEAIYEQIIEKLKK